MTAALSSLDQTFANLPSGPLVLASASATRRGLLARAGFDVICLPAHIDEDFIRHAGAVQAMSPGDIAILLAEMKGQAVLQSHELVPGQLLLAADQILEIEGEMLGKPASRDEAAEQLARLSGREHRLLTAAVMFRDGTRIWHHLASNSLHVRSLTDSDIDSYLDVVGEAALWSPGSYQIEGAGLHLFNRIEGCHYTILGLPLVEITGFLRGHGLSLSPSLQGASP